MNACIWGLIAVVALSSDSDVCRIEPTVWLLALQKMIGLYGIAPKVNSQLWLVDVFFADNQLEIRYRPLIVSGLIPLIEVYLGQLSKPNPIYCAL